VVKVVFSIMAENEIEAGIAICWWSSQGWTGKKCRKNIGRIM